MNDTKYSSGKMEQNMKKEGQKQCDIERASSERRHGEREWESMNQRKVHIKVHTGLTSYKRSTTSNYNRNTKNVHTRTPNTISRA